jgi:hypothetical protein
VKSATGAATVFDTETFWILVLVPLTSVTVSVTEYVPAAAYVWLGLMPLPAAVLSPKSQLYVAPACAVVLLASKLHVSAEQL